MKDTLEKYIGTTIGGNLDRLLVIESIEVVSVHETCFASRSLATGNTYFIPYTNILKIIENEDGIKLRRFFSAKKKFRAIVKIGHSHPLNYNLISD